MNKKIGIIIIMGLILAITAGIFLIRPSITTTAANNATSYNNVVTS